MKRKIVLPVLLLFLVFLENGVKCETGDRGEDKADHRRIERSTHPRKGNEKPKLARSMKSINSVPRIPHDKHGNVLLESLRITNVTEHFEIRTIPQADSEVRAYHIAIVVCRQNMKSCYRSATGVMWDYGLIICWPYIEKFSADNRPHPKPCPDGYNGVSINEDQPPNLRIRTNWWNDYIIEWPEDNCFVLWLPYYPKDATFPPDYVIKPKVPQNGSVVALTRGGREMFRTGKALEYYDVISNKSNIIETQVEDHDHIRQSAKMYWHEVKLHVDEVKKGEHFITTRMHSAGGDFCCSMQAKVMAPEITKCYFVWKKLNSPDVPQEVCVPRLRPERISYKIQFTDTIYNTSVDSIYNTARTVKFGARIETIHELQAAANLKKSIKAVYDQQIADDDIPPVIRPVPRGIPDPDYDPDDAPEPETKEHPLDETKDALDFKHPKPFDNVMYSKNILCNPFVKPTTQLRQLYHVCWGVEAATGIIDVFSNDPDTFDYVKPIEDELGHLELGDPRTNCPF